MRASGSGAVRPRSAAEASARRRGLVGRLASTRLTLWLLAFLTIAMATATVVPQGAAREAYVRLFGAAGARAALAFSLDHVFSAKWFIGAFGLLALNLIACAMQRAADLLWRQERYAVVTEAQVLRTPHRARWEAAAPPGEAALAAAEGLRARGYMATFSEASGEAGVAAARGRLAPWGPVLVHLGVAVVLAGAAWGRLPRHAYHAQATLQPGEAFAVGKGRPFSVRLLRSGVEQDRRRDHTGQWAEVEVRDRGRVIRRTAIRPNHPLRHRHVTTALRSLTPAAYVVSARRGGEEALIPVTLRPDGTVDMVRSGGVLGTPPWLIAVVELREGAAARVFVEATGRRQHRWEEAGWVDQRGTDYQGVRLRLERTPSLAQLSFDRDVGVPVVWTGFALVTLGAALACWCARRRVLVVAAVSGAGCQVTIGASDPGAAQDLEAVAEQLRARLPGAKAAARVGEGE